MITDKRQIKQTTTYKLKEWSKMQIGSYFYCGGDSRNVDFDECPEGTEGEYAYVGRVTGKYDDADADWECVDVWNGYGVEASKDAWYAAKTTFMKHDNFMMITKEDYPEYFL